MSRAEARDAWGNICSNIWCDEMRHYEESFDVADASEIETADLEESQYKNMRRLDDYLYDEVNLISS
jgi:hypothetical protein